MNIDFVLALPLQMLKCREVKNNLIFYTEYVQFNNGFSMG